MKSVEQVRSVDTSALVSEIDSGNSLVLEQIVHRFGEMVALKDINLNIQPGEFVSLLGPSGCGKTTLLRIISGFLKPSSGKILLDGRSVETLSASQRGVGIVFQNYALFPHMTVWDNIAYGLRAKRMPNASVNSKVGEMLELVQLGHLAKRYPSELSGGQQQRVAIARALAVEPKLMLLDEPFSALDKNLRLDMQIEIRRLLSKQGVTAILVTHDQEEAMSMSDRIAVMSQGEIHQFDTPSQIYDQPATKFVSTFVGTCNLLPVTLVGRETSDYVVQVPGGGHLQVASQTPIQPASDLLLAVRPENLRIQAQPTVYSLSSTVEMCLPLGAVTAYEVQVSPDTKVKVTQPRVPGTRLLEKGQQIYLELASPHACSLFPTVS
ncbi:ABC transporter ATP-binding protein [Leptolyngbya sp. FACHB-711]|uniref:ABC transporter ATP-binding protein n=1 Tax=unclassified Leptolyngbya TaxID=2650499 RepID=UPI001689AB04|nr:ABC transporter ATP-binding protein [Leptolyngbya sp. FACHB-711]MBD1852607.1 ABC transporter ATP-binding protein [Cyanobacteria bacterium FACHB-502]MBD2025769.1 ABC transporter ATP-binding protein [Leptolyngbya sp. FACHB-711]